MEARFDRRPVARPSDLIPGFDLDSAYRTAGAIEVELAAQGWVAAGRKLGFTNRATWQEFDLDTAIWSRVYDRTITELDTDHACVSIGGCLAPRLEPEIVVGVSAAVNEPDCSAGIEWIAPGFEIVDCHFTGGWEFTAPDIVADFGAHAQLIVGPKVVPRGVDRRDIAAALAAVTVQLRRGDNTIDRGVGRNALGGPVAALDNLRRTLATQPYAAPLVAGEIITTGTLTDIPYIVQGEHWSAEFSGAGLGRLSIELE